MNVCIIGDGLTSLSLAKNLIKKKINVHICQKNKTKILFPSRTIGITEDNLKFFNSEILNLSKKDIWEINKIEVYSEKLKKIKILNFENKKNRLFYIVKNDHVYKLLNSKLLKNKYFKRVIINESVFYKKLLKQKKYDLIINCDPNNIISKKYFSKKIFKDYNNLAYTTILDHEPLENNTAVQVFTKFGPIAYLPFSKSKSSVVCSLETKNKLFKDYEILDLIKKNNPKFKIKKILKFSSFKLKSSSLRNYHHNNILAFGDVLHTIHPLAGQGFNMTLRDIRKISSIIQNKIDLGIQIDSQVFEEFEEKTKYKNFIFSSGIDLIYELFNFDKKIKNNKLSKIIKFFGTNKKLNSYFIKIADKGLGI